MPLGKKKANGLKTAKQDQFQSKCRILLSVEVFISKGSIACCGRKEEHMNMKHPSPTKPQSSASLRTNLTVRKCWDS